MGYHPMVAPLASQVRQLLILVAHVFAVMPHVRLVKALIHVLHVTQIRL